MLAKPPLLAAFPAGAAPGDAADVQPPKSSSAVTVGWIVLLLFADEIGEPHPPEMSLGVNFEGTLPSSTLGAWGLTGAGSGVFQALFSAPDPHGSIMFALD